jgi:hypothetical protein
MDMAELRHHFVAHYSRASAPRMKKAIALFVLVCIACSITCISGFQLLHSLRGSTSHGLFMHDDNANNQLHRDHPKSNHQHGTDRRFWLTQAIMATTLLVPILPAQAGIDPSLLQGLPVKGDESGAAQRLREVQAINRPSSDNQDIPFVELGTSGVSYREYRLGKGEAGMCSM